MTAGLGRASKRALPSAASPCNHRAGANGRVALALKRIAITESAAAIAFGLLSSCKQNDFFWGVGYPCEALILDHCRLSNPARDRIRNPSWGLASSWRNRASPRTSWVAPEVGAGKLVEKVRPGANLSQPASIGALNVIACFRSCR